MALGIITDPNGLTQGFEKSLADMVFGAPTGNAVTITSAGNGLPLLVVNELFEVRNHSTAVNNGLYKATGSPTVASLSCVKVAGSNPVAVGAVTASVFGAKTNSVTNIVFASTSGRSTVISSATALLPVLSVGSRFTVSSHSTSGNNGTYEVTVATTPSTTYTCTKLDTSTATPVNAGSTSATVVSSKKTIMYDTAARGIYLLEQGGLDLDGVLGQAFYSFAVISWKDDSFLIANAPFPMLTIDADAGKYFIGQDPSGNNSGWAPADNNTYTIRTRKLFRNMGWSEITSTGSISAVYAGIRTLGAFVDQTAGTGDQAYYQFGTDTTVDDTVSFTFNGPVNEAIQVYNGLATPVAVTGPVITGTNTITRGDGGNWRTDGYKVGGKIQIFASSAPANIGTWTITSVGSGVNGAVVVSGALTNAGADVTFYSGVDNRNEVTLRLRVRTTSGNSNARTYAQANLAAAGETALSNRLFTFGLSNSQDLNIAASDATIDGSGPYTSMTLTYYTAPQSLGGSGLLVGGPYNFGIVIVGNNGTNTQVYEWTQRQLRKSTDIDAGAAVGIGKAMDGLMRFLGPTLQVGSVDGGLTFPRNPVGGGTGVMITGLNATSKNSTVYYDNLHTLRSHPLSVAVTLDFNQTLNDDPVSSYTLFFDRTIRTTVTDLIITAGTGANGTFNSAGAGLPASINRGVGGYVRVAGKIGAYAAMNGVYQVTALTSTSAWSVTRYDGATLATTTATSCSVDQNCIDTPNAIIVQNDSATPVTGAATVDYSFSFDYSNNVQGGRSGSTDASVQARAIGQSTAQYTQSTVQTISTSSLTIPLSAAIERNFLNP